MLPFSLKSIQRPLDKQMYDRHQCLLKQLADGYQLICQQHPQPQKLVYRNNLISQITDMNTKLTLVKDLTRELTQITTSRLLHYFSLILEFQVFTEVE